MLKIEALKSKSRNLTRALSQTLMVILLITQPHPNLAQADCTTQIQVESNSSVLAPQLDSDYLINHSDNEGCYKNLQRTRAHRKHTIMVYIAADNDLFYFAWNNIKQLAKGANPNCNIIVFLNEPGIHKKTQIYLIEKNRAVLLNKDNKHKLDSGNPKTLIDFCTWVVQNFPADEYTLDLWNHGSGIDDRGYRTFNPSALFVLNPTNLMLDLDRTAYPFAAYETETPRGICFDETYKTYLDNQKLQYALDAICNKALGGRKLAILGMDACLMAMLEICDLAENYADILIASQEVELGPGWRYDKILAPLEHNALTRDDFARHIVQVYHETYSKITKDYTLSAVELAKIGPLKRNINEVAKLLIECLRHQSDNTVKATIDTCRNNIGFEEPSYIDLHSFYGNLLNNLERFKFQDLQKNHLKQQLRQLLAEGQSMTKSAVLANTNGSNLTHANGISIYFPWKKMFTSYQKTEFAQNNQWGTFIAYFDII